MNRITLEAFHNDPELTRRLFREAHRERSRAIGDALLWLPGAIARFAARAAERLRPGHQVRWIARLG